MLFESVKISICTFTMAPSLNESRGIVRLIRDSTRMQRRYTGLWRPNKRCDYCLFTVIIPRKYIFCDHYHRELRFLEYSKHLERNIFCRESHRGSTPPPRLEAGVTALNSARRHRLHLPVNVKTCIQETLFIFIIFYVLLHKQHGFG